MEKIYDLRAVRVGICLKAIKHDYKVSSMPENLTVGHIKFHKEKSRRQKYMFVCRCLKNYLHRNHDSQNRKNNLEVHKGEI